MTTSTAAAAASFSTAQGTRGIAVERRADGQSPAQVTAAKSATKKPAPPAGFSFQYKGLFPAIEEAGACFVSSIASSFRGWSTMSRARAAWERGCATTRRPSGSRASRSTRSAAGLWARPWLFSRVSTLDADERHIAGDLLREVRDRLTFLVDVGLDYLSLARGTPTLSGGESQRIRLASQIGSGLTGVLYVLDEPTIGLHPRDNGRLLSALRHLRDLGNTLVLVEHDREVIEAADHLVDFGPGSGEAGGRITAAGAPREGQVVVAIAHRLLLERQGRDSRADQPAGRRPRTDGNRRS